MRDFQKSGQGFVTINRCTSNTTVKFSWLIGRHLIEVWNLTIIIFISNRQTNQNTESK